ncbi:hypothetical protein [Cellulosimicrobium funkei]|uniref:SEC-C domain-containing protein n=1 Tax=Cellulosimicrobium funkei TaxID=264251 RepID=A0A4Y8R1E5_9MICO|nr:hypothetical protein [Cellulosimicrobium funkei]TFF10551.1 hypothetical protein E1O70_12295 [Cellulosimicrobium funkei]TGA73556.1 hypothetical protein EQW79_009535 [Cellulosimicrobium terreum]
MTYLYADSTAGDCAFILTDTWSYSPAVRHMGISDKCRVYPSRRLAVAIQGNSAFASWWCAAIEELGSASVDLDTLNLHGPETLRAGWQGHPGAGDTIIVHVGWSEAAGRFTTTVLDSRHDFDPEPYEGVFVHPTPIGYKFSPNELERAEKDHLAALAGDISPERAQMHEQNMEMVRAGDLPIPSLPDNANHVSFAEFVRDNRSRKAAHTMHHVLVGGSLYCTMLAYDGVQVVKLHDFPDDPAVLAGTLHPVTQHGPCRCGSGKEWIDCHGALELDDPCRCKSGSRFRDCCAVLNDHARRMPA